MRIYYLTSNETTNEPPQLLKFMSDNGYDQLLYGDRSCLF